MVHGGSYRLVEQVGSGAGSDLWRAIRGDEPSVILKRLRDDRRPSSSEAKRLAHELDIGRRLQGSDAAVQVLGSEMVSGHPTLVLEDFHGRSLDKLLDRPLPVRLFLKLAIALAQALAEVHRREIIHRDIKPRNIIVDQALEVVKITDFGIASLIPVEQPAALPANLIEGTPAYMSPEQTGRMNRVVDYRTDLYSLGITFYEMLTGRLPFSGRDTLEWFHAHLAKAPIDPATLVPELPRPIGAILLKLLAKGAEDRYQSALGLKADLERCAEELDASGRIEAFALGAHDVSERFQIPQKLYGREAELAELMGAFDRVANSGQPELLLVAGYAGIGKSALVQELHKPVVRERGHFLSGKFEQYKRDVPYSTITQAFRGLVQQLIGESEESLAAWKARLQEAVAINGRLIIDIIPQLEMVIGAQPAVPELPATEAQNRLHLVFERFIAACATRQHPLVIFLDDLQWVDPASLRLLEHVLAHSDTRFLLCIGAYRDNEVGAGHPLLAAVDKIAKAGAAVQTITLEPLSRAQLCRFVADTLHCDSARAESLARLVHDKTEGNPFFFVQFLRTLHQEGFFDLEPGTGTWTWDITRIEARGFSDNVIDLMVGRLRQLPAATQEVLLYAACLGNQFALGTLATICERAEGAVEEAMRESLRARQVSVSEGIYQFVHDRVQQAAYSLIPEGERAAIHLRIGRRLLASTAHEQLEEALFDIVNHLNHGVALVTDTEEKAALCWLNARAGRKAAASIAYASARKYLAQARELLPAEAWEARYADTLDLHLELSECEHLLGNVAGAQQLHDLVLARARCDPDRARAYRLRIRLYQASGPYRESVRVALEGLRRFGVEFPEGDAEIQAAFVAEHQEVRVNLRGRRIREIIDAAPAADPEVMATIGLLIEAMPSLYIGRPSLFPLVVVRAVNLSLQHGNSEESCFPYTVYGMILAGVFGDFAQAAEFSEMSLELNDKLHDARFTGSLLFLHASFINCWRKHIATSRPVMERAFTASLEVGDLVYAGYNRDNSLLHALERGDPLDEVIELARHYLAFTRQNRLHMTHEHLRVYQQWAACLRGSTRGATSFDDDGFSETASLAAFATGAYVTGTVCFHIAKQCTAVIMGRPAEALEAAREAAPLLLAAMASPITATHHFYHALALTALQPEASAGEQQEGSRLLAAAVEKLGHWANNSPENYRNRHALVSAEVARIEGRALDAERLYEEAIQSARDNGFVHLEALGSELASRFYRARALPTSADAHLRNARACYSRWGADGKVRQLDAQHPQLKAADRPAAATTVTTGSERLDFSTAIKASQAISSQIVRDQLLETLMRVMVENAGAQRAWLLLPEGEELAVAADARVQEQEICVRLRPPAASSPLPWSIVKYVHRSREKVLLGDAAAPGPFAGDAYVVKQRTRSLLCLPILRQGALSGILCLENDLVTDAFTTDRITVLEMLAGQVAISFENALLLAKEQEARAAAEAAERRSAFLAHELRTPLATAQLRLSALNDSVSQQDTVSSRVLSPALSAIKRQFDRLKALVESLLESARVQTGQLTLTRERLDLAALVREVVDLLAEEAESAGCAVEIEGASQLRGQWDRLRIEQIVTNLLTNAFKYGARKPIRIVIDGDGQGKAATARLSVSDQGIGIAEADQSRLFEPFARATELQGQRSLGVGLYLVREIVTAHGGRVRLRSQPGAGTTVVVELPVEPPSAGASDGPPDADSSSESTSSSRSEA